MGMGSPFGWAVQQPRLTKTPPRGCGFEVVQHPNSSCWQGQGEEQLGGLGGKVTDAGGGPDGCPPPALKVCKAVRGRKEVPTMQRARLAAGSQSSTKETRAEGRRGHRAAKMGTT